ncbi:MAG: flagellar biosynthetic protein FliQ [Kiritimatiellae bacterium]|nr:flagellar biosynthetic protein FliQ [Kiritimatiellia bacterium]
MTVQMALDLSFDAVRTAAMAAAPLLLTAIIVGVVINVVQTVTSIRDMSLTFVPKVVAAAIVMAITLPWSLRLVIDYFVQTFALIGQMGG